jgi:putative ABC transport system ATP-binding protein
MALIEIKNITKIYNTTAVPVTALKEINIEISEKEFTTIVGPSGSGKTTLLNILGGLDKPSQGTVIIDGKEITTMSAGELVNFRLNKIGFVFQAYNLIPVFTAIENVEFIMLLQNVSKNVATGL